MMGVPSKSVLVSPKYAKVRQSENGRDVEREDEDHQSVAGKDAASVMLGPSLWVRPRILLEVRWQILVQLFCERRRSG